MAGRIIYSIIIVITGLCSFSAAKDYQYRWVHVSRSLYSDSHVEDIRGIAETAAAHGLNGIAMAAGFDRMSAHPKAYFDRLEEVKKICEQNKLEIIPLVFSIGYGWSFLSQNRNLAAGIPVKDAPFVVKNGIGRLSPDRSVEIANGGFEKVSGLNFVGYRFHDKPGAVSFMDRQVVHSGDTSLRFEHFGDYEHGHGRVMQEVKVQPNRCYRLSCWVRTESLEPAGCMRMLVLGPDGRNLAPWEPRIESTSGWRRLVMGFNSFNYDVVRVYVGVWGGKSGKLWLDDLAIEEVGLLNVLRRAGTPVTVRNAQTSKVYVEGKDYAAIADSKLNFRFDHDAPEIKILPDGDIKEGDHLLVSYYHGMGVNRGQVSVCMSEPEVYEIMRKQAALIHKHLGPKQYLLSMDEIRAGGACKACKDRHMTMGEILGDCITKQCEIIHSVNPDAEISIWSDMLDPNHNAHGDYYLVDGDFTGSWEHVPEDLVIICWWYKNRVESLKFFSSLGFKTLAGAYYDGDTLENPKGWLAELDKTPNAIGIMYTTWQNKYDLLGPFGDLVTGK